ncbi:MAG TPA: hypothetical protein DDX54_06505 [Rhodospirillaceae bacterium]|jgi:hypothetical protein|nr:hypothetical protein [Alphaproteobacteria bacterium]HBH27034.1 hypothetical protein [Rhodospirillaceae bacterium]
MRALVVIAALCALLPAPAGAKPFDWGEAMAAHAEAGLARLEGAKRVATGQIYPTNPIDMVCPDAKNYEYAMNVFSGEKAGGFNLPGIYTNSLKNMANQIRNPLATLDFSGGQTCTAIAQFQEISKCTGISLPNMSLDKLARIQAGDLSSLSGLAGLDLNAFLAGSGLGCMGLNCAGLQKRIEGLTPPLDAQAQALYGNCDKAVDVDTVWTERTPDFWLQDPGAPEPVLVSSNPRCKVRS